jgi:hypothetical protein
MHYSSILDSPTSECLDAVAIMTDHCQNRYALRGASRGLKGFDLSRPLGTEGASRSFQHFVPALPAGAGTKTPVAERHLKSQEDRESSEYNPFERLESKTHADSV